MKLIRMLPLAFLNIMALSGIAHAMEFGQMDVHGFVSQGYLLTSHNDYLAKTEGGTTEFNDAAVNVSSSLSDRLRIGIQFLARDLGDAGNDEVELDWGFADYHWRDELGLRIGKVKRPMGLYNEGRDVDLLRTYILLPQSIYREDMRDIMNAAKGGAVYGTIPSGLIGSFDYQYVYGSKDIDLEPTALQSQYSSVFPTVDISDIKTNVNYTSTAYMTWNTPLKGLKLGVTYETAQIEVSSPAVAAIPTNTPGVNIPAKQAQHVTIDLKGVWVASVEYRWQDFTLAGELMNTSQEFTLDPGQGAHVRNEFHSRGYYGSMCYRFSPWLEAGSYYSVYYPDRSDKDGDKQAMYGNPDYKAWQKDACLTLRFDITPNWLCKLEGHHIDGVAQVFDYEDPGELAKVWSLYAAKITFSF